MEKPSAEQIEQWSRRIAASDREAFDRLFRALYPRLVHFGCRYLHNKSVASDIVQDAFVALWEKRRSLDPSRSIKAYIYQIVRNRCLNYIRDHSSETVGLEEMTIPQTERQPAIEINTTDGPAELIDHLQVWIEDLPDRQREAFKLSRFEGLDHEEIADVMEISSNTVNNHIVAALSKLNDRYDEYQKEINLEP